MGAALRALLASKKFLVLIASAVAYVAGRIGFNVSASDAEPVIVLASAYLLGQGIADHGIATGNASTNAMGAALVRLDEAAAKVAHSVEPPPVPTPSEFHGAPPLF